MRNRKAMRWLLLSAIILTFSAASVAQVAVGVSVRIGPPPLPVYGEPLCPGPGYLWTPGYWAWSDDDGYYWVPGTWVVAPVGLLWTPGYWGWAGGLYLWHAGYWGPHIGFYGGINYGFGYGGVGFVGGEWRGGTFFYNRYVTNVSATTVTNVYNRTVSINENHVAFNGGEAGIQARPTPAEEAAEHEQHTPALAEQTQQEHLSSQNRANFASENHGNPAVAATARPGDFSSHSAVGARSAGGEYHAPAMSPKDARVSTPGSRGGSNDGFRPFTRPGNEASSNGQSRSASTSGSQSKTDSSRRTSYKRSTPPKNNNHKASPPPPKKNGKER